MVSPGKQKDHYSLEEMRKAVGALSKGEMLNLYGMSSDIAIRYKLDPRDLLNEAFVRALDGRRKCPKNVNIVAFLFWTMKSIVSSKAKSNKKHPHISATSQADNGEEKDDFLFRDDRSPESATISADILNRLVHACEENENAYFVVEALLEDQSRDDILELLDGDVKKLNSARRYIRRKYNELTRSYCHEK